MSKTQLDGLDDLVPDVAKGKRDVGYLSTGEKLYVFLAANRMDLLEQEGYTIVEALHRLGPEWLRELMIRWRNRGNPKQIG